MPPKHSAKSLPSKTRRKPFSNKQKKLQLQAKRQKKRGRDDGTPPATASAEEAGDERAREDSSTETGSEGEPAAMAIAKLNIQPPTGKEALYDPNRYKLHFQRESAEEIERRKRRAQTEPLKPVPETEMEVSVEDVYRPGSVLDIPHRPPWSYSMTKDQLDRQEESAFQEYLSRIHSNHRPQELSLFEHNLETWRQLWRVLEISDVVLLITDIRHPALHFSPALYHHVVSDLGKKLVLVLNKVDLVPPEVAVAWRHYFISKFPQLNIICFTCFPDHHSHSLDSHSHSSPLLSPEHARVSLRPRKRFRRTLPYAVGSQKLFDIVEGLYAGKEKWRSHLEVKEMIELQQQGLTRSCESAGGHGNDPTSDPEEGEEREEGGWESGDECQWTDEEETTN